MTCDEIPTAMWAPHKIVTWKGLKFRWGTWKTLHTGPQWCGALESDGLQLFEFKLLGFCMNGAQADYQSQYNWEWAGMGTCMTTCTSCQYCTLHYAPSEIASLVCLTMTFINIAHKLQTKAEKEWLLEYWSKLSLRPKSSKSNRYKLPKVHFTLTFLTIPKIAPRNGEK